MSITTSDVFLNKLRARQHVLQQLLQNKHYALSFADFKHHLWPQYKHTRHLAYIDNYLQRVAKQLRGEPDGISKLIIHMPPRHAKSTNINYFVAWLFSFMPELRVVLAAYNATLAYRNSKTIRNIIRDTRYQNLSATRLRDDSKAVNAWHTSANGGLVAAGVGGGITGHGGNLIITDDLIAGRAEAESATYKRNLKEWWQNDLLTRLERPAAIVVIGTRWHTSDLYADLHAQGDWTVINLPALAKDNDPLGRASGEALWPEFMDEVQLKELRERMGEYAFAALYQQEPIAAGSRLFDIDNIQVIDNADSFAFSKIVRFYDLAVTTKSKSSYTVGLKLGVTTDEQFVVLDVWRKQAELPDVHEAIVRNAQADGVDVQIRLEAEKAGIVELQYMLRDPRLRQYTFDALPPRGDKYTRASPIAARVQNKRVFVLKRSWTQAFLDELSVFPHGDFADQVDALSGAYAMLSDTPRKLHISDNIFFN
ncbi:MAG: hypothetical protein KatS3mg087_1788 [Patescibacteria group bacterium]|nr:MAG: hypothetical protein KatS3mg087_1788 [Patescibacteria group bacterium]